MFAKRLFYVSASILMLALAYHLGARSAGAQLGSSVAGFAVASDSRADQRGEAVGGFFVLTPNGDIYARNMSTVGYVGPLLFVGNLWTGAGPTSVQRETWGQLKARYRGGSGRE